MIQVRDLLKSKKINSIFSLSSATTVLEAMRLLAQYNVGALLVVDDGKLVGILSERDIVRKVDTQGRISGETLVREIMTEKVLYVKPEQPLEECMALMTEKRIRHLPVMENERLLGVISIGDVLREVIHEQEFMINHWSITFAANSAPYHKQYDKIWEFTPIFYILEEPCRNTPSLRLGRCCAPEN